MVSVLAVADTDSYLKWSVSTLAGLGFPDAVQVVLDNPVAPSADQCVAAGAASSSVLDRRQLARLVERSRPDVVLLGCTGPVVASLLDSRWARRTDRPVLVTGLPGISVPASRRALRFRAGCDLFLLHSRREVAEFSAAAAAAGLTVELGLARLPFLPRRASARAGTGPDVVLAAQAKVPADRGDREALQHAQAATGHGVVKLRAVAGEQQTHHERHPYPALYADLVADGRIAEGSVRFSSGPMRTALTGARALVTVSSTAALEAMAAGVPVLLVDDFGVSTELINTVFEGSGCFGSLADLAAGRFGRPDPGWLVENYFQPDAANDARARLEVLLARRAAEGLQRPVRTADSAPARWRRRLRLSPAALAVRGRVRALRGRTARGPHPVHPGS